MRARSGRGREEEQEEGEKKRRRKEAWHGEPRIRTVLSPWAALCSLA
jgi:hypothetical protein